MARSKEAENRILAGLKKVAALVAEGSSPNDAIIKVAQEDKMPPGYVRMMVNAHNVGKTTRQRQESESIFDKAAEFPLADAATVLNAIYPKEVKTAAEKSRHQGVSEEYAGPPEELFAKFAKAERKPAVSWEDAFGDVPSPEPYGVDKTAHLEEKVFGAMKKIDTQRQELYLQLQGAYDKVASAFGDLVRYFRTPGSLPFEDVRTNCETYFGDRATPIFDKLACDECNGKCGGAMVNPMKPKPPAKPKAPAKPKQMMTVKRSFVVGTRMTLGKTPYLEVETLLQKAAEHAELFNKIASFEKEAAEATFKLAHAFYRHLGEEVVALPPQAGFSILKRAHGEKRAFFPSMASTIGMGTSMGLGKEMGESIMRKLMPRPEDKLKADAYEDITDPSHEARLRAIRAEANLTSILNSPYFEGEDPQKISQLFNHIAKLSPRMVEQPLVMESVMRRHLAQGQADPHDLDQVLGLETKMKGLENMPSDVGLHAPHLSQHKPHEAK